MRRRSNDHGMQFADIAAIASGAILGMAVGYVVAENVGRVNSARVRRAVRLWKEKNIAAPRRPGLWTTEAAERLEARVLDALNRQVVLARRPIRVTVLGMGLVELTGRVAYAAEVALAGDVVQDVPGVDTVLNHLLVPGVDPTDVAVAGPSVPRAARG